MSDTQTFALSDGQAFPKWKVAWFRPYVFISGVYIFLALVTQPLFQGDGPDYVDSILSHANGGYYQFWDFGHLLWRAFGWLVYRVSSPLLAKFVGADPRAQIMLGLMAVSWLAGLGCALLLVALLRLYCAREWVPELVVTSFVCSAALLNYSRTGCSYIPGLFLLILATYLMARAAAEPGNDFALQACAGVALAGSVSLWFLYALAAPAAILIPFAAGAPDKHKLRLSLGAFFFFSLSVAFAYITVLAHLRIGSVTGAMVWVHASAHGIETGGVSRAMFGWPRSVIDMGDAGRVIKRYLVRDPLNPISPRNLLQRWPEFTVLGLFYVTVLAMVVNLRRFSSGRKALLVSLAGALPVLGFAIHWNGAALERYLPLCPFFFLLLCLSLADEKALHWTKLIAWTFVACVVLGNTVTLRNAAAEQAQARAESRVNGLLPQLKPESLVIVSHNLDDLGEYSRNFPFSRVNRLGVLSLYPLVVPGDSDVANWRENFASHAVRSWRAGGDVWISNRLFHAIPQADWNWVEGDDRRVSWADLGSFLSRFQYGQSVGGEDGFILLLRSSENRKSLAILDSNESAVVPTDTVPPRSAEARRDADRDHSRSNQGGRAILFTRR